MSSLSISPSLKRPFTPEDQGPVQKKQKVSSDAEVIACLADTICKFGEDLVEEAEDYLDQERIEVAKEALTCVLGLNRKVDVLYSELVEVLQKIPPSTPEEIKARTNTDRDIRQEVEFKDSETIERLAKVICKFAGLTSETGSSSYCKFVIETLKESSKLNETIDKVREEHIEDYLSISQDDSDYCKT